MGDFRVDKDAFKSRMKKLYAAWKDASEDDLLSQIDSLVIAVGTADVVYSKSISMQTWLFGYELPDTVIALCRDNIIVLSSKRKINFVQQVEGACKDGSIPPFKLLIRDKNVKDKSNIDSIIEAIKSSSKGKTIGVFSKDKFSGDLLDSWKKAVEEAAFEKVDVSASIAFVMAPKDESELSLIKKASNATMDLFHKYVREQLVDIIDKEKQVKHSKLAKQIEDAAQNNKYVTGLDTSHLDTCYQPIIQSGGKYELKFSAKVGDNILHFGAIVCMVGLRYKSYCSNIARTLMVGPTPEMQANYTLLLKAQDASIAALRHGVKLPEVYNAAIKLIQSEKPELVDKLTRNAGFGMGLEFREASMLISPRTELVAVKGMVFNLNLGFSDLLNKDAKDEEGKIYSLFIGDTVIVNDENTPATVLTPQKRQSKHAFIFLKEEQDEEEEETVKGNGKEEEEDDEKSRSRGQRGSNRARSELTEEEKRHDHQRKLAEKLHREAMERNAGHRLKEDEKKDRKVSISYKNESNLPCDHEISELKVFVDKKHETVVFPFHGRQVPFHIATIKNISQSVEGEHTCLRINFFHAGSNIGRNDGLIYPMENEKFLKEMVLRSSNSKEPGEISSAASNLKHAHDSIKEVQKKFKSREAEEREKEGVMKQDSLIISPSAGNPKLNNVYIRPNILSKRISGVLEAHANGLRFTSVRKDRVDILYNNIKTAFFQPCDGELVILVHFHLKNAILFGKKKHVDVQFYTEVGEVITDLGKHQYSHDRDDLRAEQSERELRNKLKDAFMGFCNKVSAKGSIKFEEPIRTLGFYGAPNRSTVHIQPTDGCLINLTEWPPFVVTLKEVEVVHFERVSFQLKNFDIVFVFKDYHKKVAMITAVPMTQLDHVKNWLNTCDIKFSEGVQSLNWSKIMKTIADNPSKFFNDGGWKFLDPESDEENEDDDDDEEDDAYNPSDSGTEEDSSEGDSDDSNWSAEEDDEDSDEELGSSEESGKDWDELEEEAKRADASIFEEEDQSKIPKHKSSSKHHRSPEKKHHRSPDKKHHKSGDKKHHKSPDKKHKSSKDHKHKNGHSSREMRDKETSLKRKHHDMKRK